MLVRIQSAVYTPVAQSGLEQGSYTSQVASSNLAGRIFTYEWERGLIQQIATLRFAGSNPASYFYADVAQSVEQRSEEPRVVGSTPTVSTSHS